MADNIYVAEDWWNANVLIFNDDGSGTDLIQVLGIYAPRAGWSSTIRLSDTAAVAAFGTVASITINGLIENGQTGGGADWLTGNALGNRLTGDYADQAGGNDQLDGNGGNDTLYGMGGTDLLYGGTEQDLLFGDNDPALGPVNIATGDDTLWGGDGNDTLVGGFGTNHLHGDRGFDTADYSGFFDDFGNFTYAIRAVLSTGVAQVFAIDAVDGTTSTAALDQLTDIERVVGTAGADWIEGFKASNVNEFSGTRLVGGDGNDTLESWFGTDTLQGDGGNDTYRIYAASARIEESAGAGNDSVFAGVSFTLAADDDIERLSTNLQAGTALINLTGNSLSQTITGNAAVNVLSGGGGNDTIWGYGGADTLNGGPGADRLIGGADNDTYLVDNALDNIVETAGFGIDRVLASANFTLAADDDIEVFATSNTTGIAPIRLTGNQLAQSITGNAGANALSGGGGNDKLVGLLGKDTLAGGDGQDTLQGGCDADVLTGNTEADLFIFAVGDTGIGSALRDTITDFTTGLDKIRLTSMAAGQVFIGAVGFHHIAGEVQYVTGTGLISGDTTGDGLADYEISLGIGTVLVATDLVL